MNRTTSVSVGVVFALTTGAIYLGFELANARAATQAAMERAQALEARLGQLEVERLARAAQFGGGAFAARLPGGSAPPAVTVAADPAAMHREVMPSGANASPEMRRYQHAQARANSKRLYADFVAEQGLSADEARALFDLLASNEIAESTLVNSVQPAEDSLAHQREFSAAARSLLGSTRAGELDTYRKTLMLRFEVAALADQFEGSNTPLSEEQRRSILRSISDPSQLQEPTFAPGQTDEEVLRTYSDWQESQSARFTSLVRSTLTSEQVKHYDDFESARREMRAGN